MSILQNAEEQVSLQSKKHAFVREEIWKAAMDLFWESGFDETTIEQIAERASVSRRTFFRYFSSKEAVMSASMRGYGETLVRTLRDQPKGGSAFETARSVVSRVSKIATESPYAERTFQIISRSSAARSAHLLELPLVEDELERTYARRAGVPSNKQFVFRILASMTLTTTKLSIYKWIQTPGQSIEDIVDEAFSSLSQICCPQTNKALAKSRPVQRAR